MNHKPDMYALSEEEHERRFRERVVPRYFKSIAGSSADPTAVILGGQPGAGKTALLEPAEKDLRAIGPTVVINGDDLRSFHPDYSRLQKTDPENAAQLTNHDSGRWVEKLIAEGIERRVNLVIESTMRNPDVFAATSQRLLDAGYSVEARAIAVNERLSWQGVHTRYEGMIEKETLPRFTVREAHDAGVNGMLKTLTRIEEEKLADRVLIGTRGGQVIYDNRIENGDWKETPAAAQAVENERARIRSAAEIEAISAGWQSVLAKMDKREASPAELALVRDTAIQDMAAFRAQTVKSDRREILDRNPDPLKLYNELYSNAVRDASARPMDNLEAHAQGRLEQSYAVLKLVELARDNDAIPVGATIVATGARVQDKQSSREFPAAHRIPADLSVRAVDGSQVRLTEHFGVDLNRVAIERDVFAPTDRLSRIANVADGWLEQGGMKKSLVLAANMVAQGMMSADEAMTRVVEPGYQGSLIRAVDKIERNFSYVERTAINRAVVDEQGRPLRATAQDLKLRTADLDTRSQAKAMVEQTFNVYGRHVFLGGDERQKVDQLVEGIAFNERNLTQTLKPLIASSTLPDLTPSEISERALASDRVQNRKAEVEQLSRIVYGSSTALSEAVQSIDRNPVVASSYAATVRSSPEEIAPLSGNPGGWIRSASPDRKSAEAHAPQLAAAIENYGQALSGEQARIVSAHSADQRRVSLEVPAPSPQLSATLRSPASSQAARFRSHPETRKELTRLSVALDKRLAPLEHKALRTGDFAFAQKSMGMSAIEVRQVAQIKQQITEANRLVQSREIAQKQDSGLAISQ